MTPKRRLLSTKNLLAAAILAFSLITGIALMPEPADYQADIETQAGSLITLKADWDHILYGDETGGGHLHGTGIPCKSEFPASWDEQAIKTTLMGMAANDNANWRKEDNGYYVSEQKQDNLKVRIVLDGKKSEIITGYPLNVTRNPCPRDQKSR